MFKDYFDFLLGFLEGFDKGVCSNFCELYCIGTELSPDDAIGDSECEFCLVDDVNLNIVVFVLEGDGGLGCLHIQYYQRIIIELEHHYLPVCFTNLLARLIENCLFLWQKLNTKAFLCHALYTLCPFEGYFSRLCVISIYGGGITFLMDIILDLILNYSSAELYLLGARYVLFIYLTASQSLLLLDLASGLVLIRNERGIGSIDQQPLLVVIRQFDDLIGNIKLQQIEMKKPQQFYFKHLLKRLNQC